MSPLASWATLLLILCPPTLLLYCALRLSSLVARAEEEIVRQPLHRHTCSRCGRVQHWDRPFDQWSPCRACQLAERNYVVIDLDDFADSAALGRYLDGADEKRDEHNCDAMSA